MTRLGPIVRPHAGRGDAADVAAIPRNDLQGEEPNKRIAALAPAILHLAPEGDETARQLVLDSSKPPIQDVLRLLQRPQTL